MNNYRRKFLKETGTVAAGLSILPTLSWSADKRSAINGRDELLKKLAKLNDAKIQNLLTKQVSLKGDRWDGGVIDNVDLPNAHSTNWFIVTLSSSYANEFSIYYKSATLEKPMERAITCLLNVQHKDGTIDLHSTNFHSTPDTAFIVNYLSPGYVCLKRMNQPGLKVFVEKTEKFFLNSGKCLISGGIHTPNHRWVVCSALARLNSFFPNQKYLDRMDQWLGEGVDLDPDGQYTERSVSVYTPTCNNMFLTMGRMLGRPDFFEIVRTNLAMSLYYIQPGGEVLTDASNRQDRAMTRYVNEYYYAYRYFSILDKNPAFAAVCELIEDKMPERISHYVLLLLEDPIFEKELTHGSTIPDNYFKRFKYSGVFRIRRGDTDISVIEKNPTFLSYRKGNAVLQSMRLAASFFGRGQFEGEQAAFDGNTIVLKKNLRRGYYQPIPADRQTGENDWAKISREERALSEAQDLSMIVTIRESEGKVTVEADISGTPYVPVAWELSFRHGGILEGVVEDKNTADSYFLENGVGSYRVGNDVIHFGEGKVTHRWSQLRGALDKQEGYSVYITGYTPFSHTIVLE